VPAPRRQLRPQRSAWSNHPARTAASTDRIAEQAYALYLAGEPGGELDHWLRAEQEVRGEAAHDGDTE
jgi:hypothetical protein